MERITVSGKSRDYPIRAKGVLHLIDTLEIGGAERMAVNLVNCLPSDRFAAHLGTTRRDGPLADSVVPGIPRLQLSRKRRFDPSAINRLVQYIRSNGIDIVHAHGSSLFTARIAATLLPSVRVIWHDHYGRVETTDRPAWIYRHALRGISGVISVSASLATWARNRMGVPSNRVWQLNNFATASKSTGSDPDLSGKPNRRIVCVANLRPEKGHRDLLAAIAIARVRVPDLHLFLVGAAPDSGYLALLKDDARRLDLLSSVTFLGEREDVPAILRQCSIAVLSSHNEGLPVALLEYGLCGLAVVTTDVGECSQVLDDGRCGIVVGVRQPEQLAVAIERLLTNDSLRAKLGMRLRTRMESHYSEQAVLRELGQIYEAVLASDHSTPSETAASLSAGANGSSAS